MTGPKTVGGEARREMREWLAGYAPLYEHETAEIADGLLAVLQPHVAALVEQARADERKRIAAGRQAWRYLRPNRGGKVHRYEWGLRVHRFLHPGADEWEFVPVGEVPASDLCQNCWPQGAP